MKRSTYEAARLPAQQRAASEAAKWADSMEVSGPRVILDTETKRIGPRDELVEIAIVDADSGQTLYTAPIMPGGRKPDEAAAVHGLNRDRLRRMDARRWPAHHETVSSILARVSRVLSYNAEFDRRLIRQTARRYGLTLPDSNWECIMLDYARGGRWIRLSEACNREGIAVTGHHRALADARMARELLLRMEAGGVPAQPGSPTAEWDGDEGEIDGLGGGLIAAAALLALGPVALGGGCSRRIWLRREVRP